MASATGYQLIAPPQVAPGELTRVVAVLVGGADLDAALIIHVSDALVSASPGGYVAIPIPPGQTAASVTFAALGPPGLHEILSTHTGGNAGMTDPPAAL